MKNGKKILAGICAASVCLSVMPVPFSGAAMYGTEAASDTAAVYETDADSLVSAEEESQHIEAEAEETEDTLSGTCGENASYTLADGILTISGTGAIADSAFEYDDSITSVIIGEGITSIGNYAFYDCDYVQSVTFPESLTTIGDYAFYYNGNYEDYQWEVVLPANVAEIGTAAFGNCYSLESITILNPECIIYDGSDTIYSGATICGYTGSTAEAYAINYGYSFKDLETGLVMIKGSCGENAVYTIADGVLTVSGAGAIDAYSFEHHSDITDVVIEEGITSIGNRAFEGCYNMQSVSIPSTVSQISSGAFSGCDGLQEVILSENNDTYTYKNGFLFNSDQSVLCICLFSNRTSLTIPSGVTTIGAGAFSDNSQLEQVDIPENVTSIEENAFYNCYNLKSIRIENADCSIYDSKDTLAYRSSVLITGQPESTAYSYALKYGVKFADIETGIVSGKCGENASYTMMDGALTISGTGAIADGAFEYDDTITSVIIDEGITFIGSSAFYDCDYIRTVIFPESLTSIGDYAFYYTGLYDVVLPENVAEIGDSSFGNCYSLDSITISNPECTIYNSSNTICSNAVIIGYAGSTAETYAASYGYKFKDLETGTITVKGSCGETAVYTITDGVLTISGTGAIDAYSFEYNQDITDVIVEEGITGIGEGAFQNCSRLRSVSISSTVESIAPDAFHGTDSLEQFSISESNASYVFQDGCILSADGTKLIRCIYHLTNQKIPETVQEIGEMAFNGCTEIKNIVIPEHVTAIGKLAFGNCTNLEKITVMNKECVIFDAKSTICNSYSMDYHDVYHEETDSYEREYYYYGEIYSGITCGYSGSTIAGYAFDYGRIFMDIETGEITQKGKCGDDLVYEIKNGILNITGTGAMYDTPDFSGNTKLTDAVVAEGVTSLGVAAFKECTSLRAVSLPSTLTQIGSSAFYDCYDLDSIMIPDAVTSIGDFAFYACYELNMIQIPSKVETIGEYAFYDCSIKTIALPESVHSVGYDAFYSCDWLESVIIYCAECEIASDVDTFPKSTVIYGNSGSTADAYAYKYGRKFVELESGKQRQTGTCGENLTFSIENGILTIQGSGAMYDNPVFNRNGEIYEVIIGDGVTSIGSDAFYNCYNLLSLTIPAGITSISNDAFYGCSSLEEFSVDENNLYYAALDGVLLNYDKDTLVSYPYGRWEENYTVPSSVTAIESNAFSSNYLDMVTISNQACTMDSSAIHRDIILCGYTGSSTEKYAYDYNRYFCDIETGIVTLRGTCGENLVYELTEMGVLTISGTGKMDSYAFSKNSNIQTVIIESGAESIGYDAFYNCYNLSSITIPETVTAIESYAFENCRSLKEIHIPSSVKEIDFRAFEDCYALETISLSEGLEKIEDGAFYNCSSLKTLEIPASVIAIGEEVFEQCYDLEAITVCDGNINYAAVDGVLFDQTVTTLLVYPKGKQDTEYTLPETVSYIGSHGLNNSNLEKVTILHSECTFANASDTVADDAIIYGKEHSTAQSYAYQFGKRFCIIGTDQVLQQGACGDNLIYDITDGVLTISGTGVMYDDPMFQRNKLITKVVIEEGVTSIGKNAFYECSNISEVSIASTVETIHDEAFGWCSSMVSISIPAGVKTIGDQVFIHCGSLEAIDVDQSNANYTSVDGVLLDKAMQELIWYPENRAATEYTIPDSVTHINDYAFYRSNLVSISVPESVTYFGYYAFYECYNLETINFPSSLVTIGNSAFYSCWSLRSEIVLSDGIKTIGDSAFYGCSKIKIAVLPESVTRIDYQAFYDCYNLEKITIQNSDCKIYEASTTIYAKAVICGHQPSTAYDYAFANGRKFQNLETDEITQKGKCGPNLTYEIKDSVLTISGTGEMYDNPQFAYNDDITSVVIEEGVTSIGEDAFNDCDGIISVELPESMVVIASYAFSGCSNMKNIHLPDGILRIGSNAFSSCRSLEEIVLPQNLKELSGYIFSSCSSLTSVQVPEGIKKIGTNAFNWCSSMTSVALPESLTKIESGAFSYCSALASVTIPESVTDIGDSAFLECSSLTSVTIPANTSRIGEKAFGYCSALTAIEVDAANTSYMSSDGVLYDFTKTSLLAYPSGKIDAAFTVPEHVSTIGSYAFCGSNCITDLTLGTNVKVIEDHAVSDCKILANVTVENADCIFGSYTEDEIYTNVLSAGMITGYAGSTAEQYAYLAEILFQNIETGEKILRGSCGKNTEYTIQDGVLTLTGTGSVTDSFHDHEDVTSVVIGEGITSIGSYILSDLTHLQSIVVDEKNPNLCVDHDVIYTKDMTELIFYPPYKTDLEFVIPDTVEKVHDIHSEFLEKITLGANVNCKYYYNEDDSDFYYSCNIYGSNLKAFVVSEKNENLKVIDGILYNAEITQIISVPNAVTGDIEIPDSVTALHGYEFYERKNITSVKLPASITEIPYALFSGCKALTSVTIPETVVYIYGSAFSGSGIEEIVIPEQVQSIGEWCFANCADLKKITFLSPETKIVGFEYTSDDMTDYEDVSFSVINNFCQFGVYDEEKDEYIQDIQYRYDGVICAPTNSVAERYAAHWNYTFSPYNSGDTQLTVNVSTLTMAPDETFSVTANQANVTFASSDENVAVVSEDGVIQAIGYGTAIITVTGESGQKVNIVVTVPHAVTETTSQTTATSVTTTTVTTGSVSTATAESSETTASTTQSSTTGSTASTTATSATTTKTTSSTTSTTQTIQVIDISSTKTETVHVNEPVRLDCNVKGYEDGFTWTSSDPDIATVNEEGVVTTLRAGDVTITATDADGNTYTITLVVAADLQGDVNQDGNIDISDASAVLSLYAKQAAGLPVDEYTETQKAAADVNGDGSVDISDASAILSYYAQNAAGLNPTWDAILKK